MAVKGCTGEGGLRRKVNRDEPKVEGKFLPSSQIVLEMGPESFAQGTMVKLGNGEIHASYPSTPLLVSFKSICSLRDISFAQSSTPSLGLALVASILCGKVRGKRVRL